MPTFNVVLSEGYFPEGNAVIKFPGGVEIQRRRRPGATVCAKYTVIYPFGNILRLSEVQTGTRDRTMS